MPGPLPRTSDRKARPKRHPIVRWESEDVLRAEHPVRTFGRNLGTLSIEFWRPLVATHRSRTALLQFAPFGVALLLSFLLLPALYRSVFCPIFQLARAMEHITETRDFSLRVPSENIRSRELASLYDCFNKLLDERGAGTACP